MKKFTRKKTILFASIILIACLIATQTFKNSGNSIGMGGGYGPCF